MKSNSSHYTRESPIMKTAGTRRKITVGVICILLTLAACQSGTPSSAAVPTSPGTAGPTVIDAEVVIRAGIQKTLDDYNSGLEQNEKTLFTDAIDSNNQTLWKFASRNFDYLENSVSTQSVKLGMQVTQIKVLPEGLVLATITRDRDGWIAHWYFRKVDDRWVLSEPTIEETGAPQTIESGNYTFKTYPIAENINAKYIYLMENARANVQKSLGKVPEGKVRVSIFPAAMMSPNASGDLSGWYISPAAGGTDDIYILTPTSYFFGFYDPSAGWEPDIEMLLTRELARIAYARNFGNPGGGVDWFFEGLVEYVAGYDEMPDVKAAVQNHTIIPIVDPSGKETDLAHFANVENRALAYGLAESLVAFVVEKYGGLDSFWGLAKSYDRTQDIKKSIQETLGVSYEEFDTAWRTWLKEEYINRE
jgi:hypothetical protein